MAIIDPIRTRHDLASLGIPFATFPSVQPFSPRTAVGYQDLLEGIRYWITGELIPYMVAESGQEAWDANVDRLLAAVDAVLLEQNNDVNAQMNQAVQTVINAHIAFTDPVITGVLTAAVKSAFHAKLDEWYTVTDGRVKDAITSHDGPTQTFLRTLFPESGNQYWTPQWGGDNNARLGENGTTSGQYQRNGQEITAHARLIFGSSAVFGGGVLVGMNKMGPMETDWSFADGTFRNYLGNGNYDAPWKLLGIPQNENELKIYADTGNGKYDGIGALNNPNQSSEIRMFFHGTFNA